MNKTIILLILCLSLTACGPGQMFGPTITPSPTITLTPTSTFTPTITPRPTSTPKPIATPSPTPDTSCSVDSGRWVSNEMVNGLMPGPLLTFVIKDCTVTQVEIWAFPAPGELFWAQIETPIPIQAHAFQYVNADDFGEYIFEGTFVTKNASHGTIFFPKGFVVVDFTLTSDTTINWTAHLAQ